MGYGLLNAGNSTKRQALSGLRSSAREETNRNIANRNIKLQGDMADKQLIGTGASLGAAYGVSTVGTAGSLAAGAATSVGAAGAGTAAAGTTAALVGGAATMGVGLLAAYALTKLF